MSAFSYFRLLHYLIFGWDFSGNIINLQENRNEAEVQHSYPVKVNDNSDNKKAFDTAQ